ncbi:hypothetical protein [Rhodococcus rhodochrous]|nr:hypothetical protein [Rhodococcus rhodochrous]
MPDHTVSSTPVAPPNDASRTQLVQWAIGRISAQDLDSLRNF